MNKLKSNYRITETVFGIVVEKLITTHTEASKKWSWLKFKFIVTYESHISEWKQLDIYGATIHPSYRGRPFNEVRLYKNIKKARIAISKFIEPIKYYNHKGEEIEMYHYK